MKKRFLLALSALIISGLGFTSCDKDTDCALKVTVIDVFTDLPAEGIYVKVNKEGSLVDAEGYTDANGQLMLTFKAPATFNVYAKKDLGHLYGNDTLNYFREGANAATLKDGQTVECRVILRGDTLRHSY